ncbi:MAG: hypothetical protein KA715_04400 [Xanthomonadaceae bacterium]|nr:hypothetical protein [Xanthomonadaceae bacterium]
MILIKTAHRVKMLLLFLVSVIPAANATTLYLEVGPGLSTIANSGSIFNGAFTGGDLAFSTNVVFAYDSGGPLAPFSFHAGVRGQYLSGLSGTRFGNLLAVYPMVRFEFFRFYFGGGIAPLAMYRVSTAPGLDSLNAVTGGLPFFIEGGLEWKMIPDFHLIFGATAHGAVAGTGLAMFPSYEFSMQFRFLFNIGGPSASSASTGASKSGPGKWDGWRYPFGIGK